ncbi:MAG: hypothetical protein J6U54_12805 [Clostridiales bacterium]|nr:hypothetical protein [Clostridiales bacterium]
MTKRRLISIILSIVMIFSVFGSSSVLADNNFDVDEPGIERYTRFITVYFNLNGMGSSKTGQVTVTTPPVYIDYTYCTSGAANLYIYINGTHVGTYYIPNGGGSAHINIPCSAGDVLSYKVMPAAPYTVAVGSFTIYY